MPLYKPSELLEFLTKYKIQPKKALSQNFLLDRNIWEKILSTADVQEGETILEIGPGPGSLTELLLERGTKVIAVEIDKSFASALERFQNPHLTIVNQDILTYPLPKGPFKVISNLPFHIAAPILTKLVPEREKILSITAIVQEEMARRMTAKPKTKDYSSLTVFLNFYSAVNFCFIVSKNCFYPRPRVNSAVVHFVPKTPPQVDSEEAFLNLVRTAFNQRRKQLTTSLSKLYPSDVLKEALKDSPNARPEEFSLDEFLTFYQKLC